jgi:hypothetical protein
MSHEIESPAKGEPGNVAGPPKDSSNQAELPGDYIASFSQMPANAFPPGLLGECAHWALATSPRPVPEIAFATALAVICAICGRAFNIKGQGLNQYILIIGYTGSGKDVAQSFPELFYNTLRPHVAAIDSFRGPSELASAPGFIKWLERAQSVLCTFGEIGLLLAQMAKANAHANLVGIKRILLQVYSKSGRDGAFGATAYSDKDKNTQVIHRPAATIIGESTPEDFYGNLDDGLVSSGLIPRFMVFEYLGDQVELSKSFAAYRPCRQMVQRLADLAGQCLALNHNGQHCDVALTSDAETLFVAYEKFARDKLNAASTENIRHLWNRAHLKALKLAAVQAVGGNPNAPVIGPNCAQWATEIITNQTLRLVAKFANGDVGTQAGNQSKQEREAIRVIAEYCTKPWPECAKYHGTEDMHRAGVITQAHIQQRLSATVAFKDDARGAKEALTRTLKSLLEADILREIPTAQMIQMFGKHPRAFAVSDPAAILKSNKGGF